MNNQNDHCKELIMNFKAVCIIGLFLLLLSFVGPSFIPRLFTEKNADKIPIKNFTVEDTVKFYWDSSFNGDSKTVNQLSVLPPEDFLQDCRAIKKSLADEDKMQGKAQKEDLIADESFITNDSKISQEVRQKKPFENENIPNSVSNVSDYIYVTRVSSQRIKLKEQIIYQDEALVNVVEADYKGDFSLATTLIFFLKKENGGWKIIGIVDKDAVPNLWKTINYAVPRPQCN